MLHRTGFCRRCQSERAVIRRHGAFADDDVWEEGEEEEEEEEYYSIRVWRRYYYEDGEKPTKKQGKKVRFELPADGRGPLSGEDSAAAAPGKGRGEMERGDRRKTKDRAYDPPHRPRWVDW